MTGQTKGFWGSRASWIALAAMVVVVVALGFWIKSLRNAVDSNEPLLKGPSAGVATWPSVETKPQFSPDMKWVSFISDRDGVQRIWLKNQASGAEQPLTPYGGEVLTYEWSPKAIESPTSPRPEPRSIWCSRQSTPIRRRRSLSCNSRTSRWSAGARVACICLSAPHHSGASTRTRGVTEVTTKRGALSLRGVDVSADESRLVFVAYAEGMVRIFTSGPDASDPVTVTEDRINPRYLRWKGAAAREVVFVSEQGDMFDIWQVDVASPGSGSV